MPPKIQAQIQHAQQSLSVLQELIDMGIPNKLLLLGAFVVLSAIDLVANGGSIILPMLGGIAETVQETINEAIQIAIVGYLVLKK